MNENRFKKLWKKYGYYGALALGIFAFVCFIGVYSARQQTNTKEEQYVKLEPETPSSQKADNEKAKTVDESKEVAAPVATTETSTQDATETMAATTQAPTTTEADATEKAQKTDQGKSSFQADKKLAWPITGNVLLPYSMDTTVYFQTLDAYKCNPGVLIGAKKNAKVSCIATGTVLDIAKKTMHGTTIALDVGNGYTMTYGQLSPDSISVKKGDVLSVGSTVGTISDPSAQFTLEGPHLFFAMEKDKKSVNPMEYLK